MAVILQIVSCVIGTLAFAVTMNAAKRTLGFICIGAVLSTGIETIMSLFFNDFISCLSAMLTLCIYCEFTARKIKEPTTITLIPSTIPLLPGSSIYYTMQYAIAGNTALLQKYAKATLLAGLGISLGAIISSALTKIFITLKKH